MRGKLGLSYAIPDITCFTESFRTQAAHRVKNLNDPPLPLTFPLPSPLLPSHPYTSDCLGIRLCTYAFPDYSLLQRVNQIPLQLYLPSIYARTEPYWMSFHRFNPDPGSFQISLSSTYTPATTDLLVSIKSAILPLWIRTCRLTLKAAYPFAFKHTSATRILCLSICVTWLSSDNINWFYAPSGFSKSFDHLSITNASIMLSPEATYVASSLHLFQARRRQGLKQV